MGCATSMCSCTQTAVATVTPRALSHVHVHGNPRGPGRRSAGSTQSRMAPSLASAGDKNNSSLWSSYDLEIRDVDEFSDGDPLQGPCEIESDDDGGRDPRLLDHYNNNNKSLISHNSHHSYNSKHSQPQQHREVQLPNQAGPNSNNLLGENSKWTVTVRLYTQKAADQRSNDIPSVEETGSHYSSGEWPGKSGSSQGSRGSGKKTMQPIPAANGIIPKEYATISKERYSKNNTLKKPNRLHHSNSERPLTKEEVAQHERVQQTLNPTYAWGRGTGGGFSHVHKVDTGIDQKPISNGLVNGLQPGLNGISVIQGNPQKYKHTGDLSTYLSLGTNHYRTARSSLRDTTRRQRPESEETWQGLCDAAVPPSRPKSSLHTSRTLQYRDFNDPCDGEHDSVRSPSPIDSLITDYLADTEIMEDFSGSTHSLTNIPGKPTSGSSPGLPDAVVTHANGAEGPEREVTMVDSVKENKKQSFRPRAALRRHRSEPFHFLV